MRDDRTGGGEVGNDNMCLLSKRVGYTRVGSHLVRLNKLSHTGPQQKKLQPVLITLLNVQHTIDLRTIYIN